MVQKWWMIQLDPWEWLHLSEKVINCTSSYYCQQGDVLTISGILSRLWLGAVRQQAITWSSPDPDPLRWRHNGRDSVSNHQPHDCLLNRLFRRRSKKTSKLRVTGLCVWGIHRSPVNSPPKGQWRRVLMFYLIGAWMNGWVNNREAGDLRRHRDYYAVTVMFIHSK